MALHRARGSLTACVYRQLYLARAITSPSATDRTNEQTNKRVSERASERAKPSRAEICGAMQQQRGSIGN